MTTMQIRIIKNMQEAEQVWRALSPNKTIYDDWSFRYLFYRHDPQEISFYAGFENDTPVILLPLQYDPAWDYLMFFGGDFMDANRCFTAPGKEHLIPEMYRSLDKRTYLVDVIGDDPFTTALTLEDYSYFIDLSGLKTVDDMLQRSFDAKRKKNFRYLMRDFDSATSGISLHQNNVDHLDRLFALNMARHGKDSMLEQTAIQKAFVELITSDFNIKILSAVNEKTDTVESVYFGILYNNVLYSLLVGSNNTEHPGLGNFMQLQFIDWAIKDGARAFDAGLGDCGWKERWHFEREPQYEWKNF